MLQEIAQQRMESHLSEAAKLLPLARQGPGQYADARRQREIAAFSLARLIRECGNDGIRDGRELEQVQEWARENGQEHDPHRPIVGWEALAKRDMTVAGVSGSNFLVGTTNADPVTVLEQWSPAIRAGVTVVTGLRSNITYPRETARPTGYWLGDEAAAITPTQSTLTQLPLVPHIAGALTSFSKQLAMMEPAVAETFARSAVARAIAYTVDVAIINGSGVSGQPTGALNVTGIGTQSGSTLGQAGVAAMLQGVAEANGDEQTISFLTTPAIRKLLQARERATGSGFVWDGTVAGKPGFVSTAVPAATMICAAWPSVILALWGTGVQLAIDPFSAFKTGVISVRALLAVDVGATAPAAIVASTSIT